MESTAEQSAEGLAIVRVLSAVLDRLVHANATIARSDPGQVTKFHAMKAPGIAIEQYLERIHKYASCSNECFILALIYIDRLIQRNNFLLTELNVHRVVISAVLLAAKFFDDAYYNNAYYAKVGGVLVSEMNGLEVEFLFRINFSLHVPPDVFEKYRAELLSHSVEQQQQQLHPITMTPVTNTQPHDAVMSSAESMVDAASHITPSPESESCGQPREVDMGRLQHNVGVTAASTQQQNHLQQQQNFFGVGQSQPLPREFNFVDSVTQQQPSQAYNTTKQPEYVSYRNNNINTTTHHPAIYKTFPTPPVYQSQSATTQQQSSVVAAQRSSLRGPLSAPPVLGGPAPAPPHHPFHAVDYDAASSRQQYYYPVINHHGPSDAIHDVGGRVIAGGPDFMNHHNYHHQVHRSLPFSLIMDSSPSYLSESMVSITGVRT